MFGAGIALWWTILIDTAGTLVKGAEALLEAGRDQRVGMRDARGAVGAGGEAD